MRPLYVPDFIRNPEPLYEHLEQQAPWMQIIGFFPESDHHGPEVGITPEEKLAADKLHKTKIRMAWECLALNQNHYIGASTRSEVRYALLRGKPVRFLLPPTPSELERLNVHLMEIR